MKTYKITITVPSTATLTLSSESKQEAIKEARNRLFGGSDIDFDFDIDSAFFDVETESPTKAPETDRDPSPLKPYTVVLEARSSKEVPVMAESPDAALQLVREMYFNSSALDFDEGDVVQIYPSIKGDEVDRATLALVRLIRDEDIPLFISAAAVRYAVHEFFFPDREMPSACSEAELDPACEVVRFIRDDDRSDRDSAIMLRSALEYVAAKTPQIHGPLQ